MRERRSAFVGIPRGRFGGSVPNGFLTRKTPRLAARENGGRNRPIDRLNDCAVDLHDATPHRSHGQVRGGIAADCGKNAFHPLFTEVSRISAALERYSSSSVDFFSDASAPSRSRQPAHVRGRRARSMRSNVLRLQFTKDIVLKVLGPNISGSRFSICHRPISARSCNPS